MRIQTARSFVAAFAVLALANGCSGDGYVDHRVRVIIPSEIRTIAQGTLRLSLWSYDKTLADAPASLIDESDVAFSHQRGSVTQREMRVSGNAGGGSNRHYITVRGFELTNGEELYLLWDGLRGTQAPRVVIMEYAGVLLDDRVASSR